MKTESEQVQRWDDIIFENRNKAYGAYAIRKSYDDNVLTGTVISLSAVALIFLSSFLSINNEASVVEVPNGPICIFPVPPNLKPQITPRTQPPIGPKQVNKNLPPVAVPKDVPDKPDSPIEPIAPGTAGGNGNPVDGSSQTGTDNGTVEIPQPPPPPFVLYAEHMPAYEGGNEAMMKFLQKKMRYPVIAQRNHIEGTVYVSFVISSEGTVTNVEVVKGISKECDKEAMRVISMMDRWSPGLHNKMPVAVKLILPIKFKLDS